MSTSYLRIELFMNMAKVSASQVPYKGTGEAVQGLVGGQVQFMGASLGAGRELVKAGKLIAVAVISDKRLAAAPRSQPWSKPLRCRSKSARGTSSWHLREHRRTLSIA